MKELVGLDVSGDHGYARAGDPHKKGPSAAKAMAASGALRQKLVAAGAEVETMPGLAGAPDLVLPANAGMVLNGTIVPARFLHPQRTSKNRPCWRDLVRRGMLDRIVPLPVGMVQDGAGGFVYDVTRDLAWCGHGQCSSRADNAHVEKVFLVKAAPMFRLAPSKIRCH